MIPAIGRTGAALTRPVTIIGLRPQGWAIEPTAHRIEKTSPPAAASTVAPSAAPVAVEVVGTSFPGSVARFPAPDVIFGVGMLTGAGNAARRRGGLNVPAVSDAGVADAGRTGEALATHRDIGVSRGDLDAAAVDALDGARIVTHPRDVGATDAQALCRKAW